MKNYTSLLSHVPLFAQISPDELDLLLPCLQAHVGSYQPGEMILSAGQSVQEIGIVLEGTIQVSLNDAFGNCCILSKITVGDIFAEAFCGAKEEKISVDVDAVTACKILFIQYAHILAPCSSACNFHARLIQNLVYLLAQKNVLLNTKIRHLSKRTTREKLLSYLSECAQSAGSRSFTIPFDRQQLADYLCIERSAMSAEISKLRRESILECTRSEFRLL